MTTSSWSEATPEEAIKQAICAPKVYQFASLLHAPAVAALETSNKQLYDTLKVFCYGVFADLPAPIAASLPAPALNKLRGLTLVSMACHERMLPYQQLLPALGLTNTRELEDLVIDGIYEGLLKAKLDSKLERVEVLEWCARDSPPSRMEEMIWQLGSWSENSERVRREGEQRATSDDVALKEAAERVEKAAETLAAAKQKVEKEMASGGGPSVSQTSPLGTNANVHRDHKKRFAMARNKMERGRGQHSGEGSSRAGGQ